MFAGVCRLANGVADATTLDASASDNSSPVTRHQKPLSEVVAAWVLKMVLAGLGVLFSVMSP